MVIDGTRASTLEAAIDMKEGVKELLGDIPFVILVNKVDLKEQWEITDAHLARLNAKPEQIFFTSAKNGEHVEEAFAALSRYMAL
jgi:signal recognition particle receptor subunit beta